VHPFAEPGGGDGVERDVCGAMASCSVSGRTGKPPLPEGLGRTEFMAEVVRVDDGMRECVR